LLTPRRCQIVA